MKVLEHRLVPERQHSLDSEINEVHCEPMMRLRTPFIATACLFVMAFSSWGGVRGEDAKPYTPIQLWEAELLIYLLPEAHHIRSEGMDVTWENGRDPNSPGRPFYYFWVYNAKRKQTASVTVGHFAVNKYTAEIWDSVLMEKVTSPEIEGVQRMLRTTHSIDSATLKKHEALEP